MANSSARRDLRVELGHEQPVADGERGGQLRGRPTFNSPVLGWRRQGILVRR
jgi:hypothetical protein